MNAASRIVSRRMLFESYGLLRSPHCKSTSATGLFHGTSHQNRADGLLIRWRRRKEKQLVIGSRCRRCRRCLLHDQCSAARRTAAGRAPEAVIGGHNSAPEESIRVEILDVRGQPSVNGHLQGQVEVAIEECAIPADTDLVSAHQAWKGLRIERST